VKTIGNILWFVLGGVWLALGYALAGILCFITIIGIPFGIQAFKMAAFVIWPFGRDAVRAPDGGGVFDTVGNVIWLVLVGWELFLAHLLAGTLLCITIIGIPFGLQAFKLSVLSLWPFGREIVEVGDR
jgi:uncharacterized membrane protein YccF (DUF307 family)